MNEVLYKHSNNKCNVPLSEPFKIDFMTEFVHEGQYTFIKNKNMTFKIYISG